MFELSDNRPKVEVSQTEFNRLLGFPPGHLLEGRARDLAAEVRHWYALHGRPWFYARQVSDVELRDGRVIAAGTEFASPRLHDQLAAAEVCSVVVVAVSAGSECEA